MIPQRKPHEDQRPPTPGRERSSKADTGENAHEPPLGCPQLQLRSRNRHAPSLPAATAFIGATDFFTSSESAVQPQHPTRMNSYVDSRSEITSTSDGARWLMAAAKATLSPLTVVTL